jgi:serine/threonine-protein kinase
VSGNDLLGQLADEFVKRYRHGERPALTEYATRYPELAEQIRELFPALVLMEDVRPSPQPAAATTLDAGSLRRLGEYRIVREVGRGGMGVVYEAEQESLGRRVALKLLPPGALADARQVERFQREARAAARLHHTNIVPIFGVGEENGTHYYVMQYIEGRPLDEVLAELRRLRFEHHQLAEPVTEMEPASVDIPKGAKSPAGDKAPSNVAVARALWQGRLGPGSEPEIHSQEPAGAPGHLPAGAGQDSDRAGWTAADSSSLLSCSQRPYAKTVAQIGLKIAEALDYAAGQGVLHRDVKPSNLLLDVWGTVWLTDFGLAKASGTPDLTRTGDLLGTLRYLAPERFEGRADVRSDVYSLGLTLYEMLALRPAFTGHDQAELVGRISAADAPRLDQLSPPPPRDLVTIVHKAMAPDPADRYQSAEALAEDLRRFLDDRSIMARRAGFTEQTWRWCRRNPTMAGLLTALLVLLLVATGGSVWLVQQRAERRAEARRQEMALRRDIEAAQIQAAAFRNGLHFREGRERLQQARRLLESAGPDDLHQSLDQAVADQDLAEKLDAARLQAATNMEGRFDFSGGERLYAAAFALAGLDRAGGDPEEVSARVQSSGVRATLVAALDDRAVSVADRGRRAWLLEVARRADPDLWRDRVRSPAVWESRAALAELARTAPVAEQPVSMLVALGDRLGLVGWDATEFLRRVQRAHPDDFWANLALGNALKYREPGEAIGYYRVALAIRPGVAASYYNLGEVLKIQGWLDEAIGYYLQALRIDPAHVWAHLNLGNALQEKGRLDETLAHFRQAVQSDPQNIWARVDLGYALKDRGQLEEAAEHFRQGIAIDPNSTLPLNGLRAVQIRQGRAEEVQSAWRNALANNPPDHPAWFGYAELCLFLDQEEDYRRARKALLVRFGANPDRFIAERTGRACLLFPVRDDEMQKAAALIDRAVASRRPEDGWAYPFFAFAEGLAEYRRDRLERTLAVLAGDSNRAMQPAGRLVLAMAQYRLGQSELARQTLAAAVRSYDWSANLADGPDAWICHVLRREAEAMMLPNLPAFLKGEYQPRDNDERLALLGVCQFKGLHRVAARLYAEAVAADPGLADDLQAGLRYRAACFAVLAAGSQGKTCEKLDDRERARLRQQAHDWLRADLAIWAKTADAALVQKTLRQWQQDPCLAPVRDQETLAKLAPAERAAWSLLWSDALDLLKKTSGPK